MPIKDHPLSIALPQPGSRCFGQCSDNLRTGPWHRGMDAAGGSLMKHEKTHVLFNVSFSMDPPSLSAAQTSAIPSPRNKMNSNIHFEKRNTKVEPLTLGHPFLFVKLFTVSPFRRFAIARRQRIEAWQTSAVRPRSVSAHDTRRCGSVLSRRS